MDYEFLILIIAIIGIAFIFFGTIVLMKRIIKWGILVVIIGIVIFYLTFVYS